METSKPLITTADGNRHFACSPTAVMAIIVNEKEEILLLAHPELIEIFEEWIAWSPEAPMNIRRMKNAKPRI